MRIIDADALLEKMKGTPRYFEVKHDIEEMPTVFDMEKVVNELEQFASLAEDRWVNGTSNHAYQEHKCWVKAIEIVRKGGVK